MSNSNEQPTSIGEVITPENVNKTSNAVVFHAAELPADIKAAHPVPAAGDVKQEGAPEAHADVEAGANAAEPYLGKSDDPAVEAAKHRPLYSPVLYFVGTILALSTGFSNATQSSIGTRLGNQMQSSHIATASSFAVGTLASTIVRFIEAYRSPNRDEKDEFEYLKKLYHSAFLPLKEKYMKAYGGAAASSQPSTSNAQPEKGDVVLGLEAPTAAEEAKKAEQPSLSSSIIENPYLANIECPRTNPAYDPSVFVKPQTLGYYGIQVGPDSEPELAPSGFGLACKRFFHLRRDPQDPFRWWYLIAPIIGFLFVMNLVANTPELGVGVVFVVLLVGKLVSSVMIDHLGVMNMPIRRCVPITALALLFAAAGACVFVVPGIIDNPPDHPGWLTFVLILICLIVGLMYPYNFVISSRANTSYPSPLTGTWVGFFGGLILSLFAVLIHMLINPDVFYNFGTNARNSEVWMWVTGFNGCYTVAISITFVPILGASYLMCLMIVGELAGSSIYDHFDVWSIGQQTLTKYRIAGLVLCLVGIILFSSIKQINDCLRNTCFYAPLTPTQEETNKEGIEMVKVSGKNQSTRVHPELQAA